MSISASKAWALAKTLRWYHLGFAFFWATTFAGLSYSLTLQTPEFATYKLVDQTCAIVAIISLALVVKMRGRFSPKPGMALVASALLGAGVLLFYVAFRFGETLLVPAVFAGLFVGVSSGMFYVFWQYYFTSEGASRTALYIPLSAIASAILCFVVQLLPTMAAMMCVVAVLPLFAAWSLYKALAEIELPDGVTSPKTNLRTTLRDMWKPVFCVCTIGFVWKLVSNLFENTDANTMFVVLAGFSAAALVIAAVELFSERGFEVLRSYQILFPLITGAFLLPVVLGFQFAPVLSGTLMFGFEVVNLLLIITCAVYANEHSLSSTYVYAWCLTPTFVAMLVGDALGMRITATITYDLSLVVGVLFVCVYVLSCMMLLASWTRRRRQGSEEDVRSKKLSLQEVTSATAPNDAHSQNMDVAALEGALLASISAKLESIDSTEPLSQREREVASLVVRGYSVAVISRRLFISENTVRGHTKNIYRKLGVHSKQQLIDLVGV